METISVRKLRNEFRVLRNNQKFTDKLLKDYDHFLVNITRITKNKTKLTGFELHHILPLSQGGNNDMSNLIFIPTAVHKMFVHVEHKWPTRKNVLDFCNEYTNNEKMMSVDEFKLYLKNIMFNKKEYNKEYTRQYRLNNPDKVKQYNKEYSQRPSVKKHNKERMKEHSKQYYENNKEQIKEYKKQYYEDNKEQIKEYECSKNGKLKGNKTNTKRYFKKSKKLNTKMNNLFKYQCLSNIESTEGVYWRYNEEQNKIIWKS